LNYYHILITALILLSTLVASPIVGLALVDVRAAAGADADSGIAWVARAGSAAWYRGTKNVHFGIK
jgi:hypothetical protein